MKSNQGGEGLRVTTEDGRDLVIPNVLITDCTLEHLMRLKTLSGRSSDRAFAVVDKDGKVLGWTITD